MKKLVVLLSVFALLFCFACNEKKAKTGDVKKEQKTGKQAQEKKVKTEKTMIAAFETSLGMIEVKLFPDKAPKTVKNFVALARGEREWTDPKTLQKVKKPLYDATIFHRVIPNFMIQGGDPKGNGTGGPGYKFEDEFHPELKFDRPGLLAMANAGPNTNGSQFFITESPNTKHLTNRHTIFGEVVKGMDVVKAIARVPRDSRDKPMEDVVLKKLTISEK